MVKILKGSGTKPHPSPGKSIINNAFVLTPEFKENFNAIEKTKQNYFITGEAGTGKTTFLHFFRKNTKKSTVVLAPTGIAAINSGGQTIHSFFHLPPKLLQKEDIRRVYHASRLFKRLELLMIDEVSMVRADLLDAIDQALRLNTGNFKLPFGGVQIVLVGDLCQLPPVVDKGMVEVFEMLYETPYFFSAKAFGGASFLELNFQSNFRQKNLKFLETLNKIRNQSLGYEELKFLNTRVVMDFDESDGDYITLTPTNAAANAINNIRLERLQEKEFLFEAKIKGKFDRSSYPTEVELRLKVGSQVLLIKNDSEKRWVNGTLGEIAALKPNKIEVRINNKVHEIFPQKWEKIKYKFDEKKQKIVEEVVGSFEQFPIKLAWALTIHKSQGLTFDNLIVDLDHGAFTHGQVYVALSRCRTLEGIILRRPVTERDILFDSRIHSIHKYFQKLNPPKGNQEGGQ